MTTDYEIECVECNWIGDTNELIEGKTCPQCGGTDFLDYEPEDEENLDE